MKNNSKVLSWIVMQVNKVHSARLRIRILQALPFWIASLLAGLIAVIYAKLFLWSEHFSASLIRDREWLIFILTPVSFLAAATLVKQFASYSRGSGIPQVMASIELASSKDHGKISKLLGLRVIFIKIASSLVMVSGGGAIGREGPTIQIAGSIFYLVNKWIPENWPKIIRQNMIMTGAAAGLAAAFNTPSGGIVFAVEELTKTHISYFRTALFSAVIIAGLTAQSILAPYLYPGFPNVNNLAQYIFAGVILVACLSGFAGAVFSRSILYLLEWKSRFVKKYEQVLWIIACGFAIALIAYFVNPVVLGSGAQVLNPLLFSNDKQLEWYVPFLRMTGPIITFVAGGAGGIFAPSLSAGATIGTFVADYWQLSPSNANLLILSGMVGFLTVVTRTPFTAAILVLEMTDRHSVIFYLMLAAMTANLIALTVDKRSFYDHLKKQYLGELLVGEPRRSNAQG